CRVKISGARGFAKTLPVLNTEAHLVAENVKLEALNKYLGLSEAVRRGDIERLTIDATGVLNVPRTWNGTASAHINNFREQGIFFDRADFQVVARDETATLPVADLVHGQNKFHLRGSAELPGDIRQFGRSAATLELTGEAVDLHALTSGDAESLTGSAQINGKIEIKEGKLEVNLEA